VRVLVAGATGAIGRPLVARLAAAGHEVTGTTRSDAGARLLRGLGAAPAVVDATDTDALAAAVAAARPEVVVHQLTALSQPPGEEGYDAWLEATNRLRRDVTPALVAAAARAGARRLIAQSVVFMTAPEGPPVGDETARVWTEAPPPLAGTIGANLAMEDAVLGAPDLEGVVLRYGFFYGPGTMYAPGGTVAEALRAGRYPLVGDGDGVTSFVHTDDAAAATVSALTRGAPGVYNVVDDEPAPVREWAPVLARLLGGPPPARLDERTAARELGAQAVYYGAHLRGASNARARRELGFAPRYPSWRTGFAQMVASGGG